MQDVVSLGSAPFVSVTINGVPIEPTGIPPVLAVTSIPFTIHASFKNVRMIHFLSLFQ